MPREANSLSVKDHYLKIYCKCYFLIEEDLSSTKITWFLLPNRICLSVSFVAFITNKITGLIFILHYLFLLECKFHEGDDFCCLISHCNPSVWHSALHIAGTQYAFVKLMTFNFGSVYILYKIHSL